MTPIKDLKEYSKKIIQLMIILWFVGAVFGMAIVTIETIAMLVYATNSAVMITVHLPELLTYIGAPVGGGILGYLLKSAFENKEKIKSLFRLRRKAHHDESYEYSDPGTD